MGITIDSFTGRTLCRLWSEVKAGLRLRADSNVSTGRALERVDSAGGILYPTPPFSAREAHAREHPPGLSHCQGALRLRRDLGDPLAPRRSAARHLQQLPRLLHREAKTARHAGAHRPLQAQVRQLPRAPREAEEGSGAQGRCEKVRQARQGKEAQGGKEDRQGTRRQGVATPRGPSSELRGPINRRAAPVKPERPFPFRVPRGEFGLPGKSRGGRSERGGESLFVNRPPPQVAPDE